MNKNKDNEIKTKDNNQDYKKEFNINDIFNYSFIDYYFKRKEKSKANG